MSSKDTNTILNGMLEHTDITITSKSFSLNLFPLTGIGL